ncbi:Proteasome assembly chaperone 2 [Paragonimus westermani]|uniref:Proteasome assembly chaperone 2 n=1 Tax=Paragonimus westermani TaxID=34504 RepID=A0A8T0DVA3_9TREM|nr:Proteasome assembly chaperone 2 [Paragonimus westermani]
MRSPPFQNYQKKHAEELSQFLHSAQFHRVVLLSSSFAMQCKDTELLTSRVRYAVTDHLSPADRAQLEARCWPRLLPHTKDEDDLPGNPHSRVTYRLPGCGVASRLFDAVCRSDRAVPACLLNIFASEGDNTGDALYVVHKLNTWLNLLPKEKANVSPHKVWLPPPSWALLYGTSTLQHLY